MIKSVIIDDEPEGRKVLSNILTNYCQGVMVLGEADGVVSGIELIDKVQPDVLFLDIQMNDGTGFDILTHFYPADFYVVFVTAYDQYAIKAIKFSAFDYLLKPIDPQKLIETVNRLQNLPERNRQSSEQLEVLLNNKNKVSKIALPTINGYRFVKISDVIRCESDSNYTKFYLHTGEHIVVTRTLKEFETLLKDESFIRVHQSHLINVDFVEQYIKGEGGVAIMSDGAEIEISRRRKDQFLKGMFK